MKHRYASAHNPRELRRDQVHIPRANSRREAMLVGYGQIPMRAGAYRAQEAADDAIAEVVTHIAPEPDHAADRRYWEAIRAQEDAQEETLLALLDRSVQEDFCGLCMRVTDHRAEHTLAEVAAYQERRLTWA